MIVFVDFAADGLMPWWITIVLVSREVAVTFAVRPFSLVRGIVVAASPLGKIKTTFQFVAMLLVLSTLVWTGQSVISGLTQASFFAVLGFSLASAGKYAYDVRAGLGRPPEARAGESVAGKGR